MLSVNKLNREELEFLASIFEFDNIRKYFQKYPREYQKLTHLRAKTLTVDQINALIQKNMSSDFIFNFMQGNAEGYIKQLDDSISKLEKEVEDRNKATIIALAESPFRENLSVYYKLIEKNIDDDSIKLLSTIVNSPELVKMLSSEKSDKNLSEQIEQLTKQLNEKDTLIESVNESLLRVQKEEEQKVEDLRKQLADAQTTIASLQSELNTIKAADIIPEEEIEDGYAYHSVCEVFTDYNGKIWLKRLADIEKNTLIPFECDEFKPRLFGNRNKLYHKNGPEASGTIGIWAWNASENWNDPATDYIVTSFCYNILPIQVVEIVGIKNTNDILKSLQAGIKINISTTSVIFAIKSSDSEYIGFLCSNKNLTVNNGVLKLNEECYSLDEYTFNEEDTIELSGKTYYKYLKIKGLPKTIKLYDPIKIVTDIILKRASWNAIKQKGVSKNTWKICRDYIYELPQEDLYTEICDACKCTESEAKQYVASLVENAETYINNDNVENDIIANIIPKHPEIVQKCKGLIYQDWEKENEERIAEANNELESIKSDVENKNAELENVKKEHTRLATELSVISNTISEKEKLASDVDERIKQKIEDAKKNAADFISQMAFVSPVSSMPDNTKKCCYKTGLAIDTEDIEEYDDVNTLHSLISEELRNAGVSSKYRDSLAAYMYSAYLTHTPLLLAGPCGKSIANAFSSALNARLAGVLNCSNPFDSEAIKEVINSKDNVVVIENPFSSEWIYTVLDIISTPDKFIILVTPFTEDLSIEPSGLLNYVLPIFTELFVDSEPTNAFIGSKASDGYIPPVGKSGSNRLYNRILSQMRISMLSVKRINAVVEQATSIYEINEGTDLLYILLPCAYVTGNSNKLMEMIHNKNNPLSEASPDYIKIVEHYLGEYDE